MNAPLGDSHVSVEFDTTRASDFESQTQAVLMAHRAETDSVACSERSDDSACNVLSIKFLHSSTPRIQPIY